jgi:hypothetical protein
MIVSNEYVDSLFEGTNFGESINSCVEEKRKLIAKTLRNQIDGYWSGHTAYHIAVHGGFLVDSKRSTHKRLTALGAAFLTQH